MCKCKGQSHNIICSTQYVFHGTQCVCFYVYTSVKVTRTKTNFCQKKIFFDDIFFHDAGGGFGGGR